jgi:hypothetical protein
VAAFVGSWAWAAVIKSVAKANALIVEGSLSNRRVILCFRRIIGEIVTDFIGKKSKVAISPEDSECSMMTEIAFYCSLILLAKSGAVVAQQEGESQLCHYLHRS